MQHVSAVYILKHVIIQSDMKLSGSFQLKTRKYLKQRQENIRNREIIKK